MTLEYRDGKYYEGGHEVMDGLQGPGWWDGPARYKRVNRNVISWVQHDIVFHLISKLCGGQGADIGGPSGKAIEGIININIYPANCPGQHAIVARGESLPFKDEALNFLISSHTLEHIKNTKQALDEWVRVVKVGGLIAIVMPDKRYHLHDPSVTKDGDAAWSEMEPQELLDIVKTLPNIEILLFNGFENNFDFECVIRRLK